MDVNGGGAKQFEYCSRKCEKELKRSGSDVEFAMLGASPRKIRSLGAFGARRMAGTASEVAIDQQPDEQVVCQDLTGELSNSLSEYAKKRTDGRQSGDMCSSITNQSHRQSCVVTSVSCVRFVHGDDFIITGDSVQLMWIESRVKEGLNFERFADLVVDDGVDKTVTILSQ